MSSAETGMKIILLKDEEKTIGIGMFEGNENDSTRRVRYVIQLLSENQEPAYIKVFKDPASGKIMIRSSSKEQVKVNNENVIEEHELHSGDIIEFVNNEMQLEPESEQKQTDETASNGNLTEEIEQSVNQSSSSAPGSPPNSVTKGRKRRKKASSAAASSSDPRPRRARMVPMRMKDYVQMI